MKKIIGFLIIIIMLSSCSRHYCACVTVEDRAKHVAQALHDEEITIIPLNDDVDGRELYNVVFANGKVMERMYIEEIAEALRTNVWVYDETIK